MIRSRSPEPADSPLLVGGKEPGFTWPRSKLSAVGHYSSPSLMLSIPKDAARRMLPRKLELAEQTLTGPGDHPLVVLLGRHHGVKRTGSRGKGGSYFEFVLALPFLHLRDERASYRGPYAYMRRLYLSSLYYTILGWFYAYAKRWGRVTGDESEYRVRSLLLGRKLVRAAFQPAGTPRPALSDPDFARVAAVWQQPFIGKLFFTPYLASVLDFELQHATLQPLDIDLDLVRSFVAGLPTGNFKISSIENGLSGGYRLDVPWRLSRPMSPSTLKARPSADAPAASDPSAFKPS